MKWWVAGTAGAALILAGMSIWLGYFMKFPIAYAVYSLIMSIILALIAALLGLLNAEIGHRKGWAAALRILMILMSFPQMVVILHVLPVFDPYTNGPFCSRSLTEGDVVSALCPPLWYSILLFSPTFTLAIAALMYVFWPHKQNPVIAAGQTALPSQ